MKATEEASTNKTYKQTVVILNGVKDPCICRCFCSCRCLSCLSSRRDLLLSLPLLLFLPLPLGKARPQPVAIPSACTTHLFANSTLKPFSLCGTAPCSAASAACRNTFPSKPLFNKTLSASTDRQGFVATPPIATRAYEIFPPETSTTIAAEASANSYEDLSRSFK